MLSVEVNLLFHYRTYTQTTAKVHRWHKITFYGTKRHTKLPLSSFCLCIIKSINNLDVLL